MTVAASRWLISNVAVAEDYRRRGIARQMMLAAIEEARMRGGANGLFSTSARGTPAPNSFYASLGFEVVDTESQFVRTRPPRLSLSRSPSAVS